MKELAQIQGIPVDTRKIPVPAPQVLIQQNIIDPASVPTEVLLRARGAMRDLLIASETKEDDIIVPEKGMEKEKEDGKAD